MPPFIPPQQNTPTAGSAPTKKPSLQQFGDNLKAKYGNVQLPDGRTYSQIDSVEAAQRYIKAHPEYAQAVETRGSIEQGWDKFAEMTPQLDFTRGVLKEGTRLGASFGEMGAKIADTVTTPVLKAITGKDIPTTGTAEGFSELYKQSEPKGFGEKAGAFTAQLGEFLLPETEIAKMSEVPAALRAGLQVIKDVGIAGMQSEGDKGAMVGTGVISGLLHGVPQIAQIPVVKQALLKTFGAVSGYPKQWLEVALQRSEATKAGVEGGAGYFTGMIKGAFPKFREFVKSAAENGKQYVGKLSEEAGGSGINIAKNPETKQAAETLVESIARKLNSANIGVGDDLILQFDQPDLPSKFVSAADKKAVQDAFLQIANLKKIGIKNIDATYERLLSYLEIPSGNDAVGVQAKSIISSMLNDLITFTKAVGTAAENTAAAKGIELTNAIPKQFADYAKYKEASILFRTWVRNIEETFGFSTKYPSPKDEEAAITRMLQVFNDNRVPTQSSAVELGQALGEDFVGTAAGTKIALGGKSMTPNIQTFANSGFMGRLASIVQTIPQSLIKNYISTGTLSGLEKHPVVQGLASLTGATTAEIAKEIAELVTQNNQEE